MTGHEGFGLGQGEPNSQGGPIDNTQCHIYLQGGGSENVQPTVLGHNLREYLKTMAERQRDQMENMLIVLTQLGAIYAALSAILPAASEVAKDDLERATNQIMQSLDLTLDELKYFGIEIGDTTYQSKRSILSKTVFTT
jgi:hypothetical protein